MRGTAVIAFAVFSEVRGTAEIAFAGPARARDTAAITPSTAFTIPAAAFTVSSVTSSVASFPLRASGPKETCLGFIFSSERPGDLSDEAFAADFASCDEVGDDGDGDDDEDDEDDEDVGLDLDRLAKL